MGHGARHFHGGVVKVHGEAKVQAAGQEDHKDGSAATSHERHGAGAGAASTKGRHAAPQGRQQPPTKKNRKGRECRAR